MLMTISDDIIFGGTIYFIWPAAATVLRIKCGYSYLQSQSTTVD